jgi:hypothetical protein
LKAPGVATAWPLRAPHRVENLGRVQMERSRPTNGVLSRWRAGLWKTASRGSAQLRAGDAKA